MGRRITCLFKIVWLIGVVVSSSSADDTETREALDQTLQVIADISSSLDLQVNDSHVVFIGNTKSGVSSVFRILTTDNKKLIAKKNNFGKMLIEDEDGVIGHNSSSHTIKPDKFVESNIVYLNLPGVNTNTADNEVLGKAYTNIVTSCTLQGVLSQVRKVKICLVVEADDIETNQSIFLEFLFSLKKMINVTRAFDQGLFLLINKVDSNLSDDDYISRSYDAIKTTIDSSNFEENDVEFMKNITEIFGEQNGSQFTRISIIRRPIVSDGISLAEDDHLQYLKSRTLSFLNGIKFVDKKSREIGFPLTENSYSNIKKINQLVNNDITSLLSKIPGVIRSYYKSKISIMRDIKDFVNKTGQDQAKMLAMLESAIQSRRLDELLYNIKPTLLDIEVPGIDYKSLDESNRIIQFIENITKSPFELWNKDWIKHIQSMVYEVKIVLSWYQYILRLYDTFSDFQVQTNKTLYNVADLNNWGVPGASQGLVITPQNFKMFVKLTIQQFFQTDFDLVLGIEPDDIKLLELNNIVDRTLKSTYEIEHIDGHTIYSRDSLVSSEIPAPPDTCLTWFGLKYVIWDDTYMYDVDGLALTVMSRTWTSNNTIREVFEHGNVSTFIAVGVNSKNLHLNIRSANVGITDVYNTEIFWLKNDQPVFIFQKSQPVVPHQNRNLTTQVCYPLSSMSKYKSFLIKFLNDKLVRSDVLEMIMLLGGTEPRYTPLDLIQDYRNTTIMTPQTTNIDDQIFFYQTILKKITNVIPNITESEDDKKATAQLLTSVKTKISSLMLERGSLVIDIEKYLDVVLATVADLKKYIDEVNNDKLIEHQQELASSYKAEIETKIKEALSLIENELEPEVNRIFQEISQTVELLIRETQSKIEEGEDVIGELEEKRTELKRALFWQSFFGIFTFGFSLIFSYASVSEAVIGVITGNTLLPGDINLSDGSDLPSLPLPPGVIEGQKVIIDMWLRRRNLTADFLSLIYEDTVAEFGENDQLSVSIDGAMNNIYNNLGTQSVQDVLKPIADIINKRLEQETVKVKSRQQLETSLANIAIAGMPDLVDLLNKMDNHSMARVKREDLEIVDDQILTTKAQIISLHLYLSEIEYCLIPAIQQMHDNIYEVENNLGNKTGAALDVVQWRVQDALKDIMLQITKFSKGFEAEELFAREVEKINDLMVTTIGIYDRIQEWQEQEKLIGFMANIMSPEANAIDITDPVLKASVIDMNIDMKSNMLMRQYNMAVGAFKQWVFPFAEPYMIDIDFNSTGNIDYVVNQISNTLNDLKTKLNDYYSRIDQYDEFISEGDFNSEGQTTRPFVVYKTEDFKKEIRDLLSGKEVLMPSIKNILNFTTKHAVKFNRLKLKIKLRESNETLAGELQTLLNNFDVNMIHHGNNYYSYNNVIYYVTNDKLTFTYSNEEKSDGEPIRANYVYMKVLNGDLMLSPFTSWSFQLYININVKTKASFDELLKFAELVNVELTGHAKYVQSFSGELPVLNMDSYYTSTKIDVK